MLPEIGSVVAGKYRLLDSLGEGGMGAVFEAEHVLTHKHAAIKWLHAGHLGHEEVLRRLLHEARASARVRHHNVVDVYDVLIEGRAVALVMELLTGEPLSARMARGELSFHELLQLLLPAMRGVAAAHAAGVVHRDVKPDNIFLAREEGHLGPVPKVIDFGISKVTDASAEGGATRSGLTMGTPRYVSYEQLAGAKDVDGRTDIYAFGVILYEGLAGRAPYEDAQTFSQQALLFVTGTPLPPSAYQPGVPAELDALIMRAIERDRELRLARMEDLIAGLEPFLGPRAHELPDGKSARGEAHRSPALPAPGQTTTPAFNTPVAVPSAGPPARSAPVPAGQTFHVFRQPWLWLSLLAIAGVAVWALFRPEPAHMPNRPAALRRADPEASERPVAPAPYQGRQPELAPPVREPEIANVPVPVTGSMNKSAAGQRATLLRRASQLPQVAAPEAPTIEGDPSPSSLDTLQPASTPEESAAPKLQVPSAGTISREEF